MKEARKILNMMIVVMFIALTITACSNDDGNSDENDQEVQISVAGTWYSEFDTGKENPLVISNTQWIKKSYLGSSPKSDYVLSVESFSNSTKTVVTKGKELDYSLYPVINEGTNTIYNRERFYLSDSDTFFYCQEAYNKASLEELNNDTASYTFDPDNPDDNNCGAGAWIEYTKEN